jgi:hypothetical protein
MYVCMVLNSALLLLLRSVGAALLMLADTKIFVAYMAGDQLLYLLLKLMRGDFLHWLPIEGVGGLAASLIERVMVKTLTDFTGVIQFRAPGEMGGASWLWSMCLALVAPWVAVPVYFGSLASNSTYAIDTETVLDSTDSTTDAWELERSDAWRLLGGLTAGWVRARASEENAHPNLSPSTLRDPRRPQEGVRGVSPPIICPLFSQGTSTRARSCTPTLTLSSRIRFWPSRCSSA